MPMGPRHEMVEHSSSRRARAFFSVTSQGRRFTRSNTGSGMKADNHARLGRDSLKIIVTSSSILPPADQ